MTKRIEIKDWANKHNTFIYTADMQPLCYIHCEAPVEWLAYRTDGSFIDRFTSKAKAKAAL